MTNHQNLEDIIKYIKSGVGIDKYSAMTNTNDFMKSLETIFEEKSDYLHQIINTEENRFKIEFAAKFNKKDLNIFHNTLKEIDYKRFGALKCNVTIAMIAEYTLTQLDKDKEDAIKGLEYIWGKAANLETVKPREIATDRVRGSNKREFRPAFKEAIGIRNGQQLQPYLQEIDKDYFGADKMAWELWLR